MTGAPARRMSPQRRRQHLVDTALGLYRQRPPQEVSVDEIAAEAGISRALFYRYFANIGALHAAALGSVVDELTDRIAGTAEGPLEVRLRAGLGEFFAVVRRYPDGCTALLRTGSAAGAGLGALVERFREHLVHLVLERLGVLEPRPLLRAAVRGWVAVVETALLTWLANPEPAQEELEQWLVGQLLAMVRATAEHDPGSAEQLAAWF